MLALFVFVIVKSFRLDIGGFLWFKYGSAKFMGCHIFLIYLCVACEKSANRFIDTIKTLINYL